MKSVCGLIMLFCLVASPAIADVLYETDFTSGFVPGGWTVYQNIGGGGGVWRDTNAGGRGPFVNLTFPFGSADSDFFGSVPFDTDLVSPAIDCTGYVGTTVTFAHDFVRWEYDHGAVFVSGDDGGTWTQVADFTATEQDVVRTFDISDVADNSADVRVMFHYDTAGAVFQLYWAVDNVRVDAFGPGVHLSPAESSADANPGTTAIYTLAVANNTGGGRTFDVTYEGNDWETVGPDAVSVPQGALVEFDVAVSVPEDAEAGEIDEATVVVSGGGDMAFATITTTVSLNWIVAGASLLEVMDHALVSDGTFLYRVGGFDLSGSGTATVERYDDSKGTWEYISAAPHALIYTVAATYLNGLIFVIAGGVDETISPNADTFMAYDIAFDQWYDYLSPAPGDGTWAAALVAFDDKVYKIGGGGEPGASSDELFVYDYTIDEWTELAGMNTGREFFCAWVFDGLLYVVGGIKAPDTPLDGGEIYDPATDSWETDGESLLDPRWGMACPAVGPRGEVVIVAGGVDETNALATNSYVRDLADNDGWQELGDLAIPIYRGAGVGLTPVAYVVGGSASGFVPINDVQTDRIQGLPVPGTYCVIDDEVFDAYIVNPDNPCQICDPGQSPSAWSNWNGAACDDGAFCTGTDTCWGGDCLFHSGDPCSDDGLFCDGTEYCDETTDACASTGDPCAPGSACDDAIDDCVPVTDDDTGDDVIDDDDAAAGDDTGAADDLKEWAGCCG